MINFKVVDIQLDGVDAVAVELLDQPYAGTTLVYGKISIEEVNDQAIMHFNVDSFADGKSVIITDDLKKLAGDVLIQILEEQVKNETAIYHGGT